MRAIFVSEQTILRDSHITPGSDPAGWRLAPATLEAMRTLADDDTLLFVTGAIEPDLVAATERAPTEVLMARMQAVVRAIEAGGGRVDALVACPHGADAICRCWEGPAEASGGAYWLAARQFSLSLNAAYVLADAPREALAALPTGARAMLVLGGRRIADLFGDAPDHKDLPLAEDLRTAAGYIAVEDELARQWGHPREEPKPTPDEALWADPRALPQLVVVSRQAQALQTQMVRTRTQMRDVVRWMSFLVLGAVGLSLGIAYLLTHLYRVQPFPQVVYYLTLQFISRPLRGALFVLLGAGIITLAILRWLRAIRQQGGYRAITPSRPGRGGSPSSTRSGQNSPR